MGESLTACTTTDSFSSMDTPPPGSNHRLTMTRAGAIGIAVGLVCTAFIGGVVFSALYVETSAKGRLAMLEKKQHDDVKQLLEYPFVPLLKGVDGWQMRDEAGLKNFHPSREDSVTWSFVGGIGTEDRHVEISGDGAVTVFDTAEVKQVTFLDEAQCSDFFRKVIAGLAGFSEEAVELKCDLALKLGLMDLQFLSSSSDATTRDIRISIPQLGVNREFSMREPEIELKTYPDIIEYRSAVEIEKEIQGFIPK